MDVIRWAITRPVSVSVGVILVVMFGLIGLGAIPIQLTPAIDRPVITVDTAWPGRSPQEVVEEITRQQERELKNVSNLKTMRSVSREGASRISLEFTLDTDINRAFQEVSDSLRKVKSYPEEVDQPTITATEGVTENAIAWIIIDLSPSARSLHPDFDVTTLYTAMDREVKPFLERIEGVAQVNIYGGRERQIRVMVDPAALALRNLTYGQVLEALRSENRDVSAGTIAEGKRDIRVRVLGKFTSPEEILGTVVAYREGRPVYVRDVAEVDIGYEKMRGFVRSLGSPCLAMNVIRQSNANVMSVMADVRERLEVVRGEVLPKLDPEVGPSLRLRQVYDETDYIHSSIDLVLTNLLRGGVLATIVLVLFLRSARATGVVALAIPISVIATFLVVLLAGRTLNVVSLAGLAFSTGMVVDNAIVVLENIVRRRSMGDRPFDAVYRGVKEVWGAIVASTLTTVCVFIPVLTIREEAGQIFFDLSLALTVAVMNSLIVAVTVVPAACGVLFSRRESVAKRGRLTTAWQDLFGLVRLFGRFADRVAGLVYWLSTGPRAATFRPVVIVALTAASIVGSLKLMPPLDYLPAGNRNLVFGGLLIPPGLSIDQQTRIAERIEAAVEPYVKADIRRPETVAALAPIARREAPNKPFDAVPVSNFFIGAFEGGMFVGGTSQAPEVVIPIGALFTNSMQSIPDSFGGARQTSIFGRGIGGGNTINLEISGPDIDQVVAAAGMMFGITGGLVGYGNVVPDPANFNLTQPEVRARLNNLGRELGLRTTDVGTAIRGLFDGAFAGEYILDGRTIDIMVLPTGGGLSAHEDLVNIPVATPAGPIVPLTSILEIVPGRAPQQIQRIEELPSVTIRVTPPGGMALEDVMEMLRTQVVGAAEQARMITPAMRVRLEGTAAKLDEVKASLFGAAPTGGGAARWQRMVRWLGIIVGIGGLALAVRCVTKGRRLGRGTWGYGAVGAVLMGAILATLLMSVAGSPQLLTARFVWALLVTYLLMAALFESFLYPLVILFSVPLAVVGGFGALRVVHEWTLATPTIAPQQLDVLTMIGFVILIGTVVNNAILIVVQSLNFMDPMRGGPEFAGEKARGPNEAIRESVRTRIRPIFMTTLTTLGGGLPLVIAPGAGSEMYRGLGAVICGGLLVSTVFTVLLVPLVLGLVLDLQAGLRRSLAGPEPLGEDHGAAGAPRPAARVTAEATADGAMRNGA